MVVLVTVMTNDGVIGVCTVLARNNTKFRIILTVGHGAGARVVVIVTAGSVTVSVSVGS